MSSFRISSPAAALFLRAGLDPTKVNALLDRRGANRQETILRPSHPYLVRVRGQTGVPLMMVSRRNRRIFIELESPAPFWRYRERSADDCKLLVRCNLPETVVAACTGRKLGSLIEGLPQLADVIIRQAELIGDILEMTLKPDWVHRHKPTPMPTWAV